jgi:hypothetical protein
MSMSSNISLVQIINKTMFEGAFNNLQTSADDVALNANGPTNTPGQHGEGCHIPDCGAGKWWDDHRMTVTLGEAVLSLWKEDDKVYYRVGQTVYPGPGRGLLLWADNGFPVVLKVAPDATATMSNP